MIKVFLLSAILLVKAPAGEIFGDLKLGEKYLPDVPLELKCGEETVTAKTNDAGSFRLAVKGAGGACNLTATYSGQTTPPLNVVVFSKPTQYRLTLELKDGKYALKRA
jgi:hypothetical protein